MEPVEQARNMNNLFMVLTISMNLLTTAYSQDHNNDIRLIQFSIFDRENHTVEEIQEHFGCRDVIPTGYFAGKRDMAACRGSWTGHIKNSNICAPNWHVCSSKDKNVFDRLQYQNLMKIRGCFAMNAAHGSGSCTDCEDGENVIITGAGRDCPTYDSYDHSTCINAARVDLRWSLRKRNESACAYHMMMSGAICCRDTPIEDPPQLLNYGMHKHLVKVGEPLRLECRAKGQTQPKIIWRKNGESLSVEEPGISISNSVIENITVSALTIATASSSNNAQYSCLANNKYGSDIGVQHQVSVWNLRSRKRGCRSGVRQIVLPGGEIFACEGKWKGHVKDASKRLCGRKYSVCHAYSDGMRIFDQIDVRKTRVLPGCYALDAASTKRSYCDRCNPKHKDNRMLGVGNECAGYDPSTPSCFGQGRVDVWPHTELEFSRLPLANYTTRISEAPQRTQQSCKYNAELTTGVLCCKTPTRGPWRAKVCTPKCRGGGKCIGKNTCQCPMERSGDRCEIKLLETRSCEEVCGLNATCNKRRTKCKCLKGFKLSKNKCIPK